jgi:CPA1 family monovalent cation:H+ antiporter
MQAEREEVFRLGRNHEISDELARKLVRELDLLESHQRA